MGSFFSTAKTTTRNVDYMSYSTSAKVITSSGELMEFSSPIRSSLISPPSFIICNSDNLSEGNLIQALGPKEFILPGQLYFIIPVKKLQFTLTKEDMATLVIRANEALITSPSKALNKEDRSIRGETAPILSFGSRLGRIEED